MSTVWDSILLSSGTSINMALRFQRILKRTGVRMTKCSAFKKSCKDMESRKHIAAELLEEQLNG